MAHGCPSSTLWPINLILEHGTHCSPVCQKVLKHFCPHSPFQWCKNGHPLSSFQWWILHVLSFLPLSSVSLTLLLLLLLLPLLIFPFCYWDQSSKNSKDTPPPNRVPREYKSFKLLGESGSIEQLWERSSIHPSIHPSNHCQEAMAHGSNNLWIHMLSYIDWEKTCDVQLALCDDSLSRLWLFTHKTVECLSYFD